MIEELMKIRQELDKNSDELNKRIQTFEDQLNEIAIGLAVWVKLDEEIRLGYIRYTEGWKLAVEFVNKDGEKTIHPLVRASRNHRLFCFNHLQDLLPELLETAKKFNAKVVKALEKKQ